LAAASSESAALLPARGAAAAAAPPASTDAAGGGDGGDATTSAATEAAAAAAARNARIAAIDGVIAHSCQLMNLLGHADMGLTRYVAYVQQALDADCRSALVGLCSTGVDVPAAAINAVSTMFSRAAAVLAQAVGPVFADAGPRAILVAVHTACDVHAARVVRSVARSGRIQAALVARERLLRGGDGGGDAAAAGTGSGASEPAAALSAAEAHRLLAAVEKESVDAPFALAATGAVTSPTYRGLSYLDARVLDAFTDELALLLQRCASYSRLVASTAAHVEGGGAALEGELRAAHRLRDAVAELGGGYAGLEAACIQGGVAKAVNLDELVEDGAAGASVDLGSQRALELLEAPSTLLARPLTGLDAVADVVDETVAGVGAAGAGEGAMVSTLVEDAFYVASRAVTRAFATGNADSLAAVLNSIVMALTERLGTELLARWKVAREDAGKGSIAAPAGGGGGGGAGSGDTSLVGA